ncbi:MAG: helix-turn-helix domain-containing protein [Chloroflexota bacterium]|nr:helix-turn-helix domain-containing protein [Chloroflexota bacterium]
MSDEYVTIAEAARRLGVSEPAMRRRVERGMIPVYSSPCDLRSRLVKAADLDAFRLPKLLTPAPAGQGIGGDALPA